MMMGRQGQDHKCPTPTPTLELASSMFPESDTTTSASTLGSNKEVLIN